VQAIKHYKEKIVNVYKNAKTTPKSRETIIARYQSGWRQQDIADSLGISRRTVCKWLGRWRSDEQGGLQNRSSRPQRSPNKLAEVCEIAILQLRRTFCMTAREIAKTLNIARSTVSRILKYYGLERLENMNHKEPVIRYEHKNPGDMIHIDIKKLGRIDGIGHRIHGDRKKGKGKGWEYLHIAIDDHSRIAYAEILPNEKARTSAKFLLRALRFFKEKGIKVWRVMTDNGVGYVSKIYAKIMRMLGIKHKRTRPYTPKTNGKAERFIQTCLREWAYARPYESSDKRKEKLAVFIDFYNNFREHAGIKYQTPINRINCE
jgi:transposase InsO family protein